jgi:hypothetical protein
MVNNSPSSIYRRSQVDRAFPLARDSDSEGYTKQNVGEWLGSPTFRKKESNMIQPLSCPHPRQPGTHLNRTKFAVKPEIRGLIFDIFPGSSTASGTGDHALAIANFRSWEIRVRSKRFVEPMKG